MSYLELMMSEYHMTLEHVWRVLPVVVGFAIMEAREERLTGSCMGFVSRAGIKGRQAERQRLLQQFRVIEPKTPKPSPDIA